MQRYCIYEKHIPESVVWAEEVKSFGGTTAETANLLVAIVGIETFNKPDMYFLTGIWLKECIWGLTYVITNAHPSNVVTINPEKTMAVFEHTTNRKLSPAERIRNLLSMPHMRDKYENSQLFFSTSI